MTEEQKSLATVSRALTDTQFAERHKELAKFVKNQLRESKDIAKGGDYGIIPGTRKKSLLKPGAEKLLKLFGLTATFTLIKEVEDWEKGFVYYKYRCTITHAGSQLFIADAIRSSNSKEPWMKNKSVYDAANSVDAKAQKRALVAAAIQATMASEIFDADISEYDDEAPNESVSKADDPRRAKIMIELHNTAKDHGWNDEYIHVAVEKKWQVPSLTNLSNDQLEELKDFIIAKYEFVEPGQKPKLRATKLEKNEPSNDDKPIDGEIIYYCQGKKHIGKEQVRTSIEKPWCSQECQDSIYPPKEIRDPRPWEKGFGKKNQASTFA